MCQPKVHPLTGPVRYYLILDLGMRFYQSPQKRADWRRFCFDWRKISWNTSISVMLSTIINRGFISEKRESATNSLFYRRFFALHSSFLISTSSSVYHRISVTSGCSLRKSV